MQQDQAAATVRTLTTAKNELTRAVTDALLQFHSQTGIYPSALGVQMANVTHAGSAVKTFVVGGVVVEFEV